LVPMVGLAVESVVRVARGPCRLRAIGWLLVGGLQISAILVILAGVNGQTTAASESGHNGGRSGAEIS
jgi:hypothetical protein